MGSSDPSLLKAVDRPAPKSRRPGTSSPEEARPTGFEWKHRDDDGAEEPVLQPPRASVGMEPEWGYRVRLLVEQYMDFVWRSLRRLGVAEADCDDGCQRVWLVVSRKLPLIAPSKERSYIFSVAVRVASEMRRKGQRLQEVQLDDPDFDQRLLEQEEGPASAQHRYSNPERNCERLRARQLLDSILSGMSWELRTVFVMFELEGISSPEIAQALGVSRGTVASRLRLARTHFQRAVARHESQQRSPDKAHLHPAEDWQSITPPQSKAVPGAGGQS